MAECQLVCIPPTRAHEFWPLAENYVRAAVEKVGITDFEELKRSVQAGEALLWLVWDGAVRSATVTQIATANGTKFCTIIACGGVRSGDWLGLIEQVETYAQIQGCAFVNIIGRRGWQRKLSGYRSPFVVLEKDLRSGRKI